MSNILLISKTKTTNLGNVALTSELFNLYKNALPAGNSLICVGRPVGLNLVDFDKLSKENHDFRTFDDWLKKIQIRAAGISGRWDTNTSAADIKFVDTSANTLRHNKKLDPLKTILKKILRRPLSDDYLNRIANLKAADLVVYSGAGEVADDSVFLRQLVELALAQSFGARTCAINQSINLRDERMINLLRRVYGSMDLIVVRGNVSRSRLVDWGVDSKKIHVCPDTAILTRPRKLAQGTSRKVGINFTPYNRFSPDIMNDLITYLRGNNYEVFFISNNVYGDREIINRFKEDFNVNPLEYSNDYIDFAEGLSDLAFVISSRLHTNVLALSAHVPVVPIEGHFFKTKEMFDLFDYPIPVIDKNVAGWEAEIIDQVKSLEQNYENIKKLIEEKLPKWRDYAQRNFGLVLDNCLVKNE